MAALEDLRGRLKTQIAHLPAPAHKAAEAALTKRRVWRPADPVPFDRPATRRAMRAIAGRLTAALAATRSEVAAGLHGLGKLAKAGPDAEDADALRRSLKLKGSNALTVVLVTLDGERLALVVEPL